MARECVVCKKKAIRGHLVSHANNRSNTTIRPNLQRVTIVVKGRVSQEWVCTRCLKAGKVSKAS